MRLPFLKILLLWQCRLARVNKTRIPLGADVPPAVTGPCLPGGLLPGGEGCPGPAGRLPSWWPEGRCRLPVPTVAGCREKRSNWGWDIRPLSLLRPTLPFGLWSPRVAAGLPSQRRRPREALAEPRSHFTPEHFPFVRPFASERTERPSKPSGTKAFRRRHSHQ